MEIFYSLDEIALQRGPSTVTVGSFDGIHRAHQELLRARVRERAVEHGAVSTAVTFDPHPVSVLAPEKAPRMLTPLPLKLELLERSGICRLLILPFTLEFSRWSPARFVEEVLVKALRTESVLVGDNFHFGFRQAGTPQVLAELGGRFGFRTEILEKMFLRKKPVSSSQIRILLEDGNIALSNRLLGHPFNIRGPVEPGLGIGKRQMVPTLNLGDASSLIPKQGVYITLARLASANSGLEGDVGLSAPLPSVTNVGHRPTFGERPLGVETHLLEEWRGEKACVLDLSFLYRLRDELKFDSADHLKTQILRDIRRAQSYFRRLRRTGISLADSGS